MSQRETYFAAMLQHSDKELCYKVLACLHEALYSGIQPLAMFRGPADHWIRANHVRISLDNLNHAYRVLSHRGPYQRLECIGRGGCGEVYRAKYGHTGARVAQKFIREKKGEVHNVVKEAYILARLQHPCIVRIFDADAVDWIHGKMRLCFVQELIEGKDGVGFMDEMRSPFSEVAAQEVFRQFLSGVHHMHTEGYAHRDLKCANMMVSSVHPDAPRCYSKGYMFKSVDHLTDAIDSLQVKLIDVGYSEKMDRKGYVSDSTCGTLPYMAPELFEKAILKDEYPLGLNGQLIDIWACGVVLYDFLTWGQNPLPFNELQATGLGKTHVVVEILKLTPQNRHKIPELAWHLINAMMQVRPGNRWTAPRIFQHPWMTKKFLPIQQENTFSMNTGAESRATYRPLSYGDKAVPQGLKSDLKMAGSGPNMSLPQIMASVLIPDVVKSSLRFDDRDLIGKLSAAEESKLVRLAVLAMVQNSDDTARQIGYVALVEKNRHVRAAVVFSVKLFIQRNGIKEFGHAKIFIEELQKLKLAISDQYVKRQEEFRSMEANGDSFEFFPLGEKIPSALFAPVVKAEPIFVKSEVAKMESKFAELSKSLDSPRNGKLSEVKGKQLVRASLSLLSASLADSDDEEIPAVVCPAAPKPAAVCFDRVEPILVSMSQNVATSGTAVKPPMVIAARAAPFVNHAVAGVPVASARVRPPVVAAPAARGAQKSPVTASPAPVCVGRASVAPLRQVQGEGRLSGKAVVPASVNHKRMITPKPEVMKKPFTISAKQFVYQPGKEKAQLVQRKAALPVMQKQVGTPSTRPTTASPAIKQSVVATQRLPAVAPAVRRPVVELAKHGVPVKQASRVVPLVKPPTPHFTRLPAVQPVKQPVVIDPFAPRVIPREEWKPLYNTRPTVPTVRAMLQAQGNVVRAPIVCQPRPTFLAPPLRRVRV